MNYMYLFRIWVSIVTIIYFLIKMSKISNVITLKGLLIVDISKILRNAAIIYPLIIHGLRLTSQESPHSSQATRSQPFRISRG